MGDSSTVPTSAPRPARMRRGVSLFAPRLRCLFGEQLNASEALAAAASVYLNFLSLTKDSTHDRVAALRYLRFQQIRASYDYRRKHFVPTRDISAVWASDLLRPTAMAVPHHADSAASPPSWYVHQQMRLLQSGAVFEHATGQSATWLSSPFSSPPNGAAVTPATAKFAKRNDGVITTADRAEAMRAWMARYDATTELWRQETGLRYRLPHDKSIQASVVDSMLTRAWWNRRLQWQLGDETHLVEPLVAGMRSQEKFSARLLKLGPAVVNDEWIRRAVSRYQIFLGLARDNPGQIVVPTLDIDLIWHCHMLSPNDYADDCNAIMGRILSHDTGHGQTSLDSSFEKTQQLWEKVTGEPMVKQERTPRKKKENKGNDTGYHYYACGSCGFHMHGHSTSSHAPLPHNHEEEQQIEEADDQDAGGWANDSVSAENWQQPPSDSVWDPNFVTPDPAAVDMSVPLHSSDVSATNTSSWWGSRDDSSASSSTSTSWWGSGGDSSSSSSSCSSC